MTTRAASNDLRTAPAQGKGQVCGSVRFDGVMLIPCFWLLGGAYLDAWAHHHIPLETFFTPWHAVLYSGFLSVVIFHGGALLLNHGKGYSWRHSLPDGYGLSCLGIIGFFVGGIGDLIWHLLFGIELNIDAALSPTHLALALCIGLIMSGPFRALWRRSNTSTQLGFVPLLPMLLSLTFTLSAITLISQFAHPFVMLWPAESQQDPFSNQALAVVSIMLQTIVLMGLVLLALRRWTLPFGTFTLVLTLNVTFLSFMQDHYQLIPVGFLAGLTADLLRWRLKPSAVRPDALRLFAFSVPTIMYLLYFLTLRVTTGLTWSIHLWLGSTVVAGVTSWLLSYLLVPPRIPAEQPEQTTNQ